MLLPPQQLLNTEECLGYACLVSQRTTSGWAMVYILDIAFVNGKDESASAHAGDRLMRKADSFAYPSPCTLSSVLLCLSWGRGAGKDHHKITDRTGFLVKLFLLTCLRDVRSKAESSIDIRLVSLGARRLEPVASATWWCCIRNSTKLADAVFYQTFDKALLCMHRWHGEPTVYRAPTRFVAVKELPSPQESNLRRWNNA